MTICNITAIMYVCYGHIESFILYIYIPIEFELYMYQQKHLYIEDKKKTSHVIKCDFNWTYIDYTTYWLNDQMNDTNLYNIHMYIHIYVSI